MSLLSNLSRVIASDGILATVDESIAQEPSTLMLMLSADLHWRRKEWQAAADAALQVLDRRPEDFHALSVVVTSYGHLQWFEAALPFAQRLTAVKPPSWTLVKMTFTLLMALKLVTSNGRASYRRTIERCDQEALADRDAVQWAKELISAQGADNDPVAV